MANFIQARTANEAWLQALDLLKTSPKAIVTDGRGGPTTELLHLTITIEDPRQRWVFARRPEINPAFALAEAIWIISGRNDSGVLNFFNRNLSKFAGDEATFYGAYGHRLRSHHGFDQLENAYQAISTNRLTRQVVLQIWDAQFDLPDSKGQPRSKDIPCNTQSALRVQNGKLHWLQSMRSNDIFRGLPYNLVQFTTLHEIMAGWLGLELGEYTHVVNCLHYYHSDSECLEKTAAVTGTANSDILLLPKTDSDSAFGFLNNLMTSVVIDAHATQKCAKQLDLCPYPIAYKNIGNVVLAEAARRHNDLSLFSSRLSQIQNPCLYQLVDKWMARFNKG